MNLKFDRFRTKASFYFYPQNIGKHLNNGDIGTKWIKNLQKKTSTLIYKNISDLTNHEQVIKLYYSTYVSVII